MTEGVLVDEGLKFCDDFEGSTIYVVYALSGGKIIHGPSI